MRSVQVQVPRGRAQDVLDLAKKHDSVNTLTYEASDGSKPMDVVEMQIDNRRVQAVLEEIDQLSDIEARLVYIPRGVIALYPPPGEAPEQVTDITTRSPLEVFLSGMMSAGSWRSYIAYSIAAAVIAWIAIYTNDTLLLVAAILLAPFAGPAMKFALGTARGDGYLLRFSIVRYVAGLLLTVATTAALSLIFQQNNVTSLMQATISITSVVFLQPIVTGAAGALNLVQSDNSSLVPGTAVGALIAAALTPPAAVTGMALAMGMWNLIDNGVFLLALQLVGINLAGTIVFRLYGLKASEGRYQRGQAWYLPVSVGLTLAALAGLIFWQQSSPIRFQRSSLAQTISREIGTTISDRDDVVLVETDVRFVVTRENPDEGTLLATVYVRPAQAASVSPQALGNELAAQLQDEIDRQFEEVYPLVNVIVLEPPDRQP